MSFNNQSINQSTISRSFIFIKISLFTFKKSFANAFISTRPYSIKFELRNFIFFVSLRI